MLVLKISACEMLICTFNQSFANDLLKRSRHNALHAKDRHNNIQTVTTFSLSHVWMP